VTPRKIHQRWAMQRASRGLSSPRGAGVGITP
jgi:hypothetical protein